MTEQPDPAARSRPPGQPRTKRFVLPEHRADDRADERTAKAIDAVLAGPRDRARPLPAATERPRRPLALDTRQDWMAAMRHESACHARYGRPTSIVLLELRGPVDTVTIDEAARALAEVIRSESRETDRAVRLEALAFRVLLRETGGRAASKLADRLARAFVATLDQIPGIELRVELAAPQRTETVEDALAAAESRLAEGTRPD